MSVYDVNELGLRDFAGPESQTAQAFTTGRILDSLKRGRRLFAVDTYDDTCESCLAAPVAFQTGKVYVCEQCGKTYSKDIRTRRTPRHAFKGDSIQTVKGVCGARACKLRDKHPDWSLDDCETILKGQVRVGFTKDQAITAWGRPEDINRTTSAYGTSEQWVYGYNYLYFDDGVLTTIQN
jgi:ribosomal protein L37AE/L43A